ncbi:protein RodZ, contains Xre-like HTH and DUF4115 domains [Caldanaerobius fijiensis DSM 17918]|uniref:Protein RodZ, contains Xre-like HTH and DUF4115 domains n=1 Tax=Caldanaerobius fijiensis DSM 17918 TaxID=1121256 RepID=A0A1M4WIM8_9THEO|nr:RodZ domain-containing protein [Caldanaerobius fijiensis]SHE81088.1 protein RodZ, contains Xre-like HTH and DUF4115 domains [Caldanaerobius fijiensis DSM 17918]
MSELREIGEILKTKRLEKNISISDVQEFTKIKSYYIKAIEDGEEDKLPDPVYIRGFIRSYAEMLGLNGEVLLQDLKLNKTREYNVSAMIKEKSKVNTDIRRSTKKIGRYIAIVIIIGLFIYGFYSLGNFLGVKIDGHNNSIVDNNISAEIDIGSVDKKPKDKPTTDKSNQSVNLGDLNAPTAKTEIKQMSKTADTAMYQVITDNDSYKLKIDIVGTRCWMDISVDGSSVYSGILTTGQSKELDIKSSSTVKIKLGKASDVAIYIDGQAVEKANVPGIYWYVFTK